ncbi:hypothetical protein Flavo103_03930 [Flavobacterium collinsii]|uniref:Uncharacterized protein n=1 Tax=Flavobacterium collinsii TaxID=1114861 RepID=A0ABN7EIW1_9FLAO|nr:hypothetical protein [Flavobacterium collinsii]GIQ57257.1 hypothetical protein Flavo103_03930 [Flavobacterium collinsii]CAA9196086.1 hypothetical protein FLACOL7796_00966 [Flavobacterium collinsii]
MKFMDKISSINLVTKHWKNTVLEEQESTITEYGLAVLNAKRSKISQKRS